MTDAAPPSRYPLSSAQETWCEREDLGDRYLMLVALRITGRVDVAALQAALDDVVRRHEILRSVVAREARPRYQQVLPPVPVPLHVRDLPPVTDRSRDVNAEEVILEVNRGAMDVRTMPLLRAVLGRFDDRDSVLVLATHQSVSDGWSTQLIMRDLAAFYAARTAGRPADLPTVGQYGEYATWERACVAGPDAGDALDYWREKLHGARLFALPTDRPIPRRHTRPYAAHSFVVDADAMAATAALARAMRSSTFMVLLAAFDVLAHRITGTTDPVIRTHSNGRSEARFQDTVGPFVNLLPLRTDIGGCATFRDIVARARQTCLEAYARELPIQLVERELRSEEDPRMCPTVLGLFQPQFDDAAIQIADGSSEIRELRALAQVSSEIPGGLAWTMYVQPSGALSCFIQYNPDELDERTVAGWASEYRRILASATQEPEQEWKTL
jgi:hypothetical protein